MKLTSNEIKIELSTKEVEALLKAEAILEKVFDVVNTNPNSTCYCSNYVKSRFFALFNLTNFILNETKFKEFNEPCYTEE